MFANEVEPWLAERSGCTLFSLNLHLYDIGESRAESILKPIMESAINPSVAPYACEHEVRIRITARGKTEEECRRMCREMAETVLATEVGPYCYTESVTVWESKNAIVLKLIESLRKNNCTIGVAESCTGGMFTSRMADIPGVSDVLMGGVVAYDNRIKEQVLGVTEEILVQHGAVSEECASAMAEGVRKVTGADIGISITGIAGPDGGTEEKPVGMVCFAVSDANGTTAATARFNRKADRSKVRRLSVARAMMMVIRRLGSL